MPAPSTDRVHPENPSLGGRLDCWKEIASYLGRAERTVKRWETERGMPTHRIPGDGRRSVYAFTAELDEWLRSSDLQDLDVEAKADPVPEEFPGPATVLPIAPPPDITPPLETIAEPGSIGWGHKQILIPAVCGLLLVALPASTYFLSASHSAAPRWFHAILSRSQTRPNSGTGRVSSQMEKDLSRDLYLKGRYEWSQRTPDSLNRALDSFTQSVVHDPGNAQAYAGLADTYNLLEIYTTMPETDTYPRAIAAASKAVEIDDSLAEGHRALAFAEFYGGWNFVDSEREFRRAIKMNPKDAVARRWFANAFAVPGRFTESMEQFDKAQELDPSSQSTLSDKGIVLYDAERRAEAIALLKEVERNNPTFFSPHFYLMLISLELRDYPAYLAEGQKAAEIRNDPVLKDTIASARLGYAKGGERGLLNSLHEAQKKYYVTGKLHGAMLAITCAIMGRSQEALQLLESAYEHHEMDAIWCLSDPELRTMKDEPGYQALVRRIGFPPPSGIEASVE
jgi:tetratricopeptide (TPR) repeat protein